MNLGNAIRFFRTQRVMTREVLADKANLSTSYISLLEQNKRDPAFSTIENIANQIGIPTSILLFLISDPAELSSLEQQLAEKMSYTALQFIIEKASEPTLFYRQADSFQCSFGSRIAHTASSFILDH